MTDNYDQYSREELLRLLRERDRKPKFGLVWERDEIEYDQSLNSDFVALDLDPGLSCGDAPFENLIIEGNNFDALRYLRMTHSGRVKCIYIDPPYNTGNRDFIYNDHFVDKDDAYRHSKWLEFMYRRLTLAKDLLAEDGVIFVSIDDNEMLHLGLLMDQVFGEANRIATIVWNNSTRTSETIAVEHEYIVCYALNSTLPRSWKSPRPEVDQAYRTVEEVRRVGGNINEAAKTLKQYVSDLQKSSSDKKKYSWMTNYCNVDEEWKIYYPVDLSGEGDGPARLFGDRLIPAPTGRHWMGQDYIDEVIRQNRIVWRNDRAYRKLFIEESQESMRSLIQIPGRNGSEEIKSIFGEKAFNNPKPSSLIEWLIAAPIGKDGIVLDFFAGSGTTAHAVMKLNAEDGGKRRFILVSSTEATGDAPDKNLCRDVCAERVRRVAQGYTNKKDEAVEGLGGSFAYLRTKRIPVSRVFNDIQHEQVWRALQLMHGEALTKFDKKTAVHVSGNEDDRLVYVPKLSDAAVAEVARLAGLVGRLVVYSWQPGLIRQRIEAANVAFEKIPEFLVNRFGGMAR